MRLKNIFKLSCSVDLTIQTLVFPNTCNLVIREDRNNTLIYRILAELVQTQFDISTFTLQLKVEKITNNSLLVGAPTSIDYFVGPFALSNDLD